MNDRPITEVQMHEWADGRLPQGQAERVEAWLAAHPEDRERALDWLAQSAALHHLFDDVLDEPIPARLLEAASAVQRGRRFLPRFSPQRVAAAVLWLAIGGVIGFALRGAPSPVAGMASLPRQAALAYAVYAPEVAHPVEVTADRHDHLVTWLSKRLGEKIRIPKLDAAGYALVGGRLLPGDAGSRNPAVAQFMYQTSSGQRLTLYLRNDATGNHETAFRYNREGKIDVFYWLDGPFGYALAGEVGKDEMLRLANEVYRQANP